MNRIYANVVRGMRMQERGVPLDPDRDERQAWLGHPAKTSESEGYVFNVAPFYASFMGEIRIDQRADGNISDAGSIWPFYSGCAVWPSVITIMPDWYYQFYGDRRILEQNYDDHEAVVAVPEEERGCGPTPRSASAALAIGSTPIRWTAAAATTARRPLGLMQTAYFCHNCRILARTAELLGRADDQASFGGLASKGGRRLRREVFPARAERVSRGDPVLLCAAAGFRPGSRRPPAAVAANLVDDILVKAPGSPLGGADRHAVVHADARPTSAGRTWHLPWPRRRRGPVGVT